MNTTSLDNLLQIQVKDKTTGEIFKLTGFHSRSDGKVTEIGLKGSSGRVYGYEASDRFELVQNDYGWQPFETAPKTGDEVLTTYGYLVYVQRDNNLGISREGWYFREDLRCVDGEPEPLNDLPSFWIKLPGPASKTS